MRIRKIEVTYVSQSSAVWGGVDVANASAMLKFRRLKYRIATLASAESYNISLRILGGWGGSLKMEFYLDQRPQGISNRLLKFRWGRSSRGASGNLDLPM